MVVEHLPIFGSGIFSLGTKCITHVLPGWIFKAIHGRKKGKRLIIIDGKMLGTFICITY